MRILILGVLFLTAWASGVRAEGEDLRVALDYKISKLRGEYNLTEAQAAAVRPVLKDYITTRRDILRQAASEGVVDHHDVNGALKDLKAEEHRKLSRILTEEQMKKWINKERLMSSLNPDTPEAAEDTGGGSMTAAGASLSF